MFKFLIPALALALTPVVANAGMEGPETYIVDQFDIAGVTLGMQPADARAALEERGFKMAEPDKWDTKRGPSFDELVMIMAGDLDEDSGRDSWSQMVFKKGTEEGVSIQFKPLPTGTAAYEIFYYNMSPAMTMERFMPALEQKYGRAPYVASGGGRAYWSDMKLIRGSFDIDAGAAQVIAKSGPPQNGSSAFQSVKASIKITGGKVGQADAEELAKNWTEPPKTSF